MFNKFLSCGVAAATLLGSVSAFAADAPIYDKGPMIAPAPVAPTTYDWSGVYAGVHAGYIWGDVDGRFVPGGPNLSTNNDGFAGGAQVGVNWQMNQFVFGAEGDISWTGGDGSTTVVSIPANVIAEMNYLATVRGRLGVAFDRVLVYGTGGIAFTDFDVDATYGGRTYKDSQSHVGWTIGAGVETALTENLTARAEYLYVDFDEERYTFGTAPVEADFSGSYVRAGLNYKFNMY